MSVFKKLKDILFDVEEDIPVIEKKEKHQTEFKKIEDNPIKEIKIPQNEMPIRETKIETSFNFPLDFDEKPQTRTKRNIDDYDLDHPKFESPKTNIDKGYMSSYSETKTKEPVKPFKPSPVISPVYGILDQNYTKNDVIIKTDMGVKGPNLDEVRRKAYGISSSKKETKNVNKEIDEFTEPLKGLDEILIEKEKKETEKIEIIKEKEVINILDEELPVEPFKGLVEEEEESTLETDLFNLIDSMYENRKEKEEEWWRH